MVISCPACGRRFGVADDLVPMEGRRARCAGCGEVFHATPPSRVPAATIAHYQTIGMPGDGLASMSSFTAPSAPVGLVPPAPLGGDQIAAGPTWAAALSAAPMASFENLSGLAEDPVHSTVVLDPTQLAVLRDSLEPSAVSGPWRTRDGRGRETTREKKDLIRSIREGGMEPDDGVLVPGAAAWATAGETPELAYYFRLRDEAAELAASGSAATEPAGPGFAGAATFIPAALALPWKGFNPGLVAAYALLHVVAGLAPVAGLALRLCLLTFDLLIVEEAAGGRAELPGRARFASHWEFVSRGSRASAVLFVAMAPLLAFNSAVSGTLVTAPPAPREFAAAGTFVLIGNLLLWGVFAIYAPLALGLAALYHTALPAFRPAGMLRTIDRIREEYSVVVLFFVLAAAVAAVVDSAAYPLSIVGTALSAFVWTALHFARLHLLGRVLHATSDRLGFDLPRG